MKNSKIIQGVLTVTTLTLLAACSPQDSENSVAIDGDRQSSMAINESSNSHSENTSEGMQNDDLNEIPEGMQEAENSKYEIGDQVTLLTDHMPGMKGATATIVGSFNTTAYEVTFQPTNGGKLEENHKWVIKEEITEAKNQKESLEPGTEATLEAKHMEGMEGAKATIDSSEDTTVYMIDYEPTSGGETVENHKWFTEEELSEK